MASKNELLFDYDSEEQKCSYLTESSVMMKKNKIISRGDYRTTLSANGKAKETVNSVNGVRNIVGEYLAMDSANLKTLTNMIKQTDADMAKQLGV
ncbi:MAG: TIGR04197 family type VII secretion effector [Lachnospiraceae bacterium]|nr:TIGR04197 family type VII secretion effector [Lachnospiraceae bacterium]